MTNPTEKDGLLPHQQVDLQATSAQPTTRLGLELSPGHGKLTSTQEAMLEEIDGQFDAHGRFAVTSWPEPRVSNPNFLMDEIRRLDEEFPRSETETRMSETQSMNEPLEPQESETAVTPFVRPDAAALRLAEAIVNSPEVVSAYASTEWAELHEDGQVWVAAIAREARARALAELANSWTESDALAGIVRDFIAAHRVTGPNAATSDEVYVHAGELVEALAGVVGYHKEKDDDDD